MKKILLVDDSRAVRLVSRKIVSNMELDALEAENGAEALDVVQANPDVDVVLLDWNMPVMDGLTFLKELRKLSLPKQPIVVMCTTENEMERIVEAMQNGADEYIMKPFTEDIIREKLEETGIL
ncbi:MAG: response regulator [Planctomycetaceae bacterium]|nr:response regulator [Planctomycetaceae bacterium]